MGRQVISGHTSGSILNTAFPYVGTIGSYSLIDKSGSGATITVAIVTAGDQVYISYLTLSANGQQIVTANINVNQGSELLIVSSAAIDYYFSIDY